MLMKYQFFQSGLIVSDRLEHGKLAASFKHITKNNKLDNPAEVIAATRHQSARKNIPRPLAAMPKAISTRAAVASSRVVSSPNNFENSQDLSGQVISGRSSKSRPLCPAYNRCTKPCSTKKIPIKMLINMKSPVLQ